MTAVILPGEGSSPGIIFHIYDHPPVLQSLLNHTDTASATGQNERRETIDISGVRPDLLELHRLANNFQINLVTR